MSPTITEVELTRFRTRSEGVGRVEGMFPQYDPDAVTEGESFAVRIHTSEGVTGEYVSGLPSYACEQIGMFGDYLVGKNPLARERHWSEIKRGLRKFDRMGLGPVDIALWDFAGKYHDAAIHELLGSYRDSIPAYASTFHGDEKGGLDSPGAYADFAEACLEMGYPAYKLHTWDVPGGQRRDMDREVELIHAVGERVGDEMDLMLDPAADYQTFAETLAVGRACDEQGFFWYEDPMRDAGQSHHAHRKLRELLETPLLQTELVRGFENMTNFLEAEACDYVRANPDYDGGITGVMKRARVAEGFGVDVELHGNGPERRHCIGAIRNTNYYEMGLYHPSLPNGGSSVYLGDYSDGIDAIDDHGAVPIPDGPGLGVEYDWEYIEENRTQRDVYG